jgi:hypothetical protein
MRTYRTPGGDSFMAIHNLIKNLIIPSDAKSDDGAKRCLSLSLRE